MAGWDNLFTRFGRKLIGGLTRKSAASRQFAAASGFGGMLGTDWNRREQVQHYRSVVYVAIKANANQFAQDIPDVAYIFDKGTAKTRKHLDARRMPSQWRAKTIHHTSVRPDDEIEMVRDDHPLKMLIHNPNELDTPFDFFFERELFLGLTGIAYEWNPRGDSLARNLDLPTERWIVPTPWMMPHFDGNKWVDYFECRPYGGSSIFTIPAEHVITYAKKGPFNKRDGWSALQAGDNWIDTAETMDRMSLGYIQRAAFPSLAFEVDAKEYADPDDAELERILAKISRRLAGESNIGGIVANRPGARTNKLDGMRGEELGFAQSRLAARDQILTLFQTPYTACGVVGGATDENYYQSMRGWHHNKINPEKQWFGQIETRHLAKKFDPNLRVIYRDTTPVDPESDNANKLMRFQTMSITPNEIRKASGDEPFAFGGDDPINPKTGVPMPFGTGEAPSPAVAATLAAMRPMQTSPDDDGDKPSNKPPAKKTPKHMAPFSRNGVHSPVRK